MPPTGEHLGSTRDTQAVSCLHFHTSFLRAIAYGIVICAVLDRGFFALQLIIQIVVTPRAIVHWPCLSLSFVALIDPLLDPRGLSFWQRLSGLRFTQTDVHFMTGLQSVMHRRQPFVSQMHVNV